jgi:hypothetical protein
MKKLLAVLFITAMVIGCNQPAAEASFSCDGHFAKFINDCAEKPKDKMEVGIGLDVPLYISDSLVIDQETKIDLNEGDFGDFEKSNIGTYTVFKPQLEQGILQTAWSKLSGLFN